MSVQARPASTLEYAPMGGTSTPALVSPDGEAPTVKLVCSNFYLQI